ncbi:HdeD family acid-resistance protein [Bdellovibrio sp. HCB288]|uniref:HdeD family acid-resistance protein n=1 Tax=Bdellovibrio sp. HCB288 TaxID=3394355 RepID=UPI0039B4080D
MSKKSTRLIVVGTLYTVLGLVALAFASATTFAAVMTLSVILAIGGIAQIVYGIQGRKTGQLWPHVALGCLALVCAVLIARNPVANTMVLTFMIGFFLFAGGLAKVIGAAVERTTGWGYYLMNGLVSILLAAIILFSFPVSSFWTIGTFVGVDLIIGGLSLLGLGYSIRKARKEVVRSMNSLLPETYDEIEYEYFHKQNAELEDEHSGSDEKRKDKDSEGNSRLH